MLNPVIDSKCLASGIQTRREPSDALFQGMTERSERRRVQQKCLDGKSRIGEDPLYDQTALGNKQPVSPEQVGIAEMSKSLEPGVARIGYRDDVHPRKRTSVGGLENCRDSRISGKMRKARSSYSLPGYVTIDPRHAMRALILGILAALLLPAAGVCPPHAVQLPRRAGEPGLRRSRPGCSYHRHRARPEHRPARSSF